MLKMLRNRNSWPRMIIAASRRHAAARAADQGHRRHGRRGRIVQDAGEGARGGGPRRHAEGRGPVHGVRADRRGVREAAGRHARDAAEAREQGEAAAHPHVSRRGREGDGGRRREAALGQGGQRRHDHDRDRTTAA